MRSPADPAATVPEPPSEAQRLFGERLPLLQSYADWLGSAGLTRGLLGPREVPRLWDRHLLNCAVVAELLPDGARVIDVGSGAGLPGIVLACHRPDLQVDLVEPMRRRVEFLTETVALLELGDRVRVVHGRADDEVVRRQSGEAAWVTARAVAPLGRLLAWCLPLLRPDGALLAMKGARAAEELAAVVADRRWRGVSGEVRRCGEDVLDAPTIVVVLRRRMDGRDERIGRRR